MTASEQTIILNGRVCRASQREQDGLQFEECMIIKNKVISFIGSSEDAAVATAREAGATIKDIKGKTVLPSFIDGHLHLLILGQSLTKASLDGCKSLDDIRAEVKRYAISHPNEKRIFCRGWMHSMTPDGVDASLLDDIDPRPIFIDSKDLHSTWCNSAALAQVCEEFDIGKETPDPAGGAFQRDAVGTPNGLFSESATFEFIWPFVARVASMEERKTAIKAAMSAFNAVGYTGMIDMAMDDTIWEPLLQVRAEEGALPGMRVAAYWLLKPAPTLDEVLAQVDRASELAKKYNSETSRDCRVVGIKVIGDGIIDACTASLKEPYSTGDSAEPIWKEEVLNAAVAKAHEAGLQVALHAIGDKTIKMAIDVLERNTDRSRRPRVEHIELASEHDAQRLGQLGITASIQPVHSDPAILRAWPRLLGEGRCKRAFPYREFADGGAPLALGSDAPTAPHNPLPNLYTATTRRSAREPELQTVVNPEFALSMYQAVVGATHGSAYSCFADEWTGRLEVGKSADFVVCEVKLSPDELIKGVVHETWFEGRQVFQK